MRRVRYYQHGGPEVLRLESAPTPQPGPGDLLVRTEAIGVTLPAVRKVRDGGDSTPLPGVLGGEIAGRVIAVGSQVSGFAVGDRVTSLTFTGSYADEVLAPAFMASRIPDDASAKQAVALVRSGHVALAALAIARVTPADSVLVTGAASGVGHLAIQLAKHQGAGRVVAAVSSRAKADFLYGLGADHVVTYDSDNWGDPVDVVLDGVGGDLLRPAVAALRPGGCLVFFSSGGGTIPAYELLAGSKTITGLAMAHFARTHRELYDQHHQQLWQLSRTTQLRAAVHAEISLADAATAHRIIEARANLGKVVLIP
ncbi:zinc-binding alcohol dehydrogenase family protein [Micromonospora sp. NPDC001898]|uniref:quinone oxidoreductase family protein n=1 Tax=Micromonospora sp. NPDC001898 TaxID=3364221 RepID=UPI0036BE5C69